MPQRRSSGAQTTASGRATKRPTYKLEWGTPHSIQAKVYVEPAGALRQAVKVLNEDRAYAQRHSGGDSQEYKDVCSLIEKLDHADIGYDRDFEVVFDSYYDMKRVLRFRRV